MQQFHSVDWKEKINLMDKFKEDHNNIFARRLVYEEAGHLLPKSIFNEVKRTIAEKILNPKLFKSLVDKIQKTGRSSLLLKIIRDQESLWISIKFKDN